MRDLITSDLNTTKKQDRLNSSLVFYSLNTSQASEPLREIPPITERAPNISPQKKSVLIPLKYNREFQMGFQSGGSSQKKGRLFIALWSLSSLCFDYCLNFILAVFCFIGLSFRPEFKAMIHSSNDIITIILFMAVVQIYFYFFYMRALLGCTFGESLCQMRLGQPLQRLEKSYLLKVFTRNTLILVTGIITIPCLSFIFNKDLLGELLRLKLYSIRFK